MPACQPVDLPYGQMKSISTADPGVFRLDGPERREPGRERLRAPRRRVHGGRWSRDGRRRARRWSTISSATAKVSAFTSAATCSTPTSCTASSSSGKATATSSTASNPSRTSVPSCGTWALDARLLEPMIDLSATNIQSCSPRSSTSNARASAVPIPPHQDYPYWVDSAAADPTSVATAMVFLDDATRRQRLPARRPGQPHAAASGTTRTDGDVFLGQRDRHERLYRRRTGAARSGRRRQWCSSARSWCTTRTRTTRTRNAGRCCSATSRPAVITCSSRCASSPSQGYAMSRSSRPRSPTSLAPPMFRPPPSRGCSNGTAAVSGARAERVRGQRPRPRAIDRSGRRGRLRRQRNQVWAAIIADIENPFFTAMVRGIEDVRSRRRLPTGAVQLRRRSRQGTGLHRHRHRRADGRCGHRRSVVGRVLATATPRPARPDRRGRPAPIGRTARLGRGRQSHRRSGRHRPPRRQRLVPDRLHHRSRAASTLRTNDSTATATPYAHVASRSNAVSIRRADYKEAGGYRAARSLLELPTPPDALFVANNPMAAGALRALRELGLTSPGDVGLVAFDDSPWTTAHHPEPHGRGPAGV